MAFSIGVLLPVTPPGARFISLFHTTMNHSTRAPQPPIAASSSGVRPAYPSCPLELRGRVIHSSRPSWEDLLGQR